MLHLQEVVCGSLDVLSNLVTVSGAVKECSQDEHVKGALEDGRTFRCLPVNCGVELIVYVRPKIGFCNCQTGVSDDEELERVGDISLLSDSFVPLRAGEPVKVGWMNGRVRLYDVAPRYANKQNALAVAINDKCDVIVATVLAQRTVPPAAERMALAFLNSDTVLQWARKELGL